MLSSRMPKDGFAKSETERHLIAERLKCAQASIRLRKAGVYPRPEIPVPKSAVVPLHACAQRIALEHALTIAN